MVTVVATTRMENANKTGITGYPLPKKHGYEPQMGFNIGN